MKQHPFGVGIRSQGLKAFLKNFSELKDLTYTRLSTTVEEEKSKEDFVLDTHMKEEKVLDLVQIKLTEFITVQCRVEKPTGPVGRVESKTRKRSAG